MAYSFLPCDQGKGTTYPATKISTCLYRPTSLHQLGRPQHWVRDHVFKEVLPRL